MYVLAAPRRHARSDDDRGVVLALGGVSTPGFPVPPSARARATQVRSEDSVRPNRLRAAAATDSPSSRTKRTAPALNSSVKLRPRRRAGLSDMVDIVSPFWKMSTKADQAKNK